MKIVIIGSAFAGNKGAASMLTASIQTILKEDAKAEFTLLSLYPEEDKILNEYDQLTILPTKPVYLALILNALCVLYWAMPPLRPLLMRSRHIRALAEADVFLDQGGITFVDGRELFLLYNIASILPGILVTKNVIKCSQALGPFKSRFNRFFSKLVLPKINTIITRGKITESHTKELGLTNTKLLPDYAFAMAVTSEKKKAAEKVLLKYGLKNKENIVIVAPSQVMRRKCGENNKDYVKILASTITELSNQGSQVVLLPHSIKMSKSTHNNDIPLCDAIFELCSENNSCAYIRELLGPQELRHIIGTANILITSRFHAMVSGLSGEVPVVIIGWNHKYREVMDMFNLKTKVITTENISTKSIVSYFEAVKANQESDRLLIHSKLKGIQDLARSHVTVIIKSIKV